MEKNKEKPTIGMLLDIEHVYGQHESRLGPILLSLCLGGAPILIYVYFGMFSFFPIWLFVPIEIFFIIRVVMKIQGRESYRKMIFKRQLYDAFTETASLMNIRTIHPDGCIEYVNGNILYLVACYNGTCDDEVRRSIEIRKLLNNLLGDYTFDVYIHNVTLSPELRDYYNKVGRFDKNDSAKNFIKIIDYNIDLTENNSMVQCTIYAIRGRRSDWKDIKNQIKLAVNSRTAKCYKTIYLVSDPNEINDILNRDIDSTISIQELTRKKYNTNNFDTSKVLAYDLPEDQEIIQGKKAAKPIINKAPAHTFHVQYKETSDAETTD